MSRKILQPKYNPEIVGVTELVLRDGHQSLLATRMRTDDMLPIAELLDGMGYWSLETWGGATFDACVRYLREDPWSRLTRLREAMPRTPFQMLLRGKNLLGYRPYADDIIFAFVEKAAQNGVDVFRIFDAMNDFDNMRVAIAAGRRAGAHVQGTISYTTSPVHTIDGFVALAKSFEEAGCDSIAIKDMAGIMLPSACYKLVTQIKANVSLPIHVHSHATSGLSAMSLMAATQAGAAVVDTVISAFAWGASHPSTETMTIALSEMPRPTNLDIEALEEIASYFIGVRRKYWQFESEYTGTNPSVLKHHIPGGMISNLTNQLKEAGAVEKIRDIFDEIPRVRKDLGYPPLVTPTSQIVGTQAVLNILSGERYKTVAKEIQQYLLGRYGKIPGQVDVAVRAAALAGVDEAAASVDEHRDNEMELLTAEIGALAENTEDVLTYAMFPELAKVFLQERAANQLSPEALLPIGTAARDDLQPEIPNEFDITVHGENYHIRVAAMGHSDGQRQSIFFEVDGVSEEASVEVLGTMSDADGVMPTQKRGRKKLLASKPGHVCCQMMATVVDILVEEGQKVDKGDCLLVVEAMKMETEIIAPLAGTIVAILVEKGEAIKPEEVLIEID